MYSMLSKGLLFFLVYLFYGDKLYFLLKIFDFIIFGVIGGSIVISIMTKSVKKKKIHEKKIFYCYFIYLIKIIISLLLNVVPIYGLFTVKLFFDIFLSFIGAFILLPTVVINHVMGLNIDNHAKDIFYDIISKGINLLKNKHIDELGRILCRLETVENKSGLNRNDMKFLSIFCMNTNNNDNEINTDRIEDENNGISKLFSEDNLLFLH
jgi:hypothetical protein